MLLKIDDQFFDSSQALRGGIHYFLVSLFFAIDHFYSWRMSAKESGNVNLRSVIQDHHKQTLVNNHHVYTASVWWLI